MKTFTRLLIVSALLFTTVASAQYCTLPGRVPYISIQPGITIFKLGTINRSSLCVEDMSKVLVVTTDSTNLLRGHTYSVTIKHSRDSINFPTARNNIRVWIDYNNNYSFEDAGELVVTANYQTHGYYTASFTVPTTAPIGTVRLRATAKMSDDAGHSLPTSCDSPVADPIGYHGEMEDYKVRILPTTAINTVDIPALNPVIYPNPASGEVAVSFDAMVNTPLSIDLFDATGKQLASLVNNQVPASLSYNFDLNHYAQATGVYFIKVSSAGGTSYHKVLKVN